MPDVNEIVRGLRKTAGAEYPYGFVPTAQAVAAVREAAQLAPHEPPSVPWGRVRELLLSDETALRAWDAYSDARDDGTDVPEIVMRAALAAAVDHAEKGAS